MENRAGMEVPGAGFPSDKFKQHPANRFPHRKHRKCRVVSWQFPVVSFFEGLWFEAESLIIGKVEVKQQPEGNPASGFLK